MLFDRFDNMRSKVIQGGGGGEYDYDLTKIGTPVSCISPYSLTKGNKFKGALLCQQKKIRWAPCRSNS